MLLKNALVISSDFMPLVYTDLPIANFSQFLHSSAGNILSGRLSLSGTVDSVDHWVQDRIHHVCAQLNIDNPLTGMWWEVG